MHNMAYKTIGISEKAYEILSRRKRKKESFSSVIIRMDRELSKKKNILDFAGIWSKETAEDMLGIIESERERMEEESKERIKSWRA